jgi:hypothetical protein
MFNSSKRERRTHPTLFRKRVVSLQFEWGKNLNAKIHDRTRLVVKNQKKKFKSRNVIVFLVRIVAFPFFYFYFLPLLYTSVLDIICLLIFFLEMMYLSLNEWAVLLAQHFDCALKQWNKAKIDTPIFHLFSFFLYEINKVKEKRSPMNGKMTTFIKDSRHQNIFECQRWRETRNFNFVLRQKWWASSIEPHLLLFFNWESKDLFGW